MPTNKPQVKAFVSPEIKTKFEHICKLKNRSTSNMIEFLIKEEINIYESEHGEIIIQNH